MAQPEVSVKRIGAGGFGVGILPEGKVVFIPRTAPGDKARIQVVKEKARWARGEVVELLHEGPGRREAPCPMYASCDGCSLQHLEYGEQLRWKSHLVGDTLRRLGKVEIDDPEVVPSPRELHYRNRVSYTLRRLTGGRLVAGFRELGHRGRVLDLRGQCLLPEDPLPAAWERIRQEWGPRGARLPRGRQLRLTLQKGVDGVGLMVRGGEGRGEPEVLLDRVEELVSVWHRKKGEDPLLLAGEPVMRVSWGQEVIDLEGGAFVQVNAGIGTGLYEYVLREIGDPVGRTIIDAYCGPAILGRSLSRKGGEVTGIDAVHGGAPGGDPADPRGFRYVVGRVEKELKRLLPADLVLLNPPRSGLHSSIPATLLAKPPRTVVYVSCDPATLARDLKRLESGYRVTRLRAYDLFPQTGHVETVVTLKGITEDRQ